MLRFVPWNSLRMCLQECGDDDQKKQAAWDSMLKGDGTVPGVHMGKPVIWLEYLHWRRTQPESFNFEEVFEEHAQAMQVDLLQQLDHDIIRRTAAAIAFAVEICNLKNMA